MWSSWANLAGGITDLAAGVKKLNALEFLVVTLSLTATPVSAAPDDWSSPTASHPVGLCCMGFAYDQAHHNTILFGGNDGAPSFNSHGETWELAVGGWIQRFPANAPSARSGPGMAYDAATGTVVLFGGNNGVDYNDTWIWNGQNWTQAFPPVSPPARAFETNGMAYSPACQCVVMFGGITSSFQLQGDTWTWNGVARTWTPQITPAALTPRRAPLARDDGGNVLLYGGDNYPNAPFADTWVWTANEGSNSGAWRQRHPVGPTPGPLALAATAYDPVREAVVLFGGVSDNQVVSGAWIWKEGAWTQLTTATVPPPRYAFGMDYDPRAQGVVLYGGFGAPLAYADLWTLGSNK